MAKIYLAASPGSVPVQSMFSTAGYMLNSKRSSMALYINWTWCCSFMTTMMWCA